MTIKTICSGMSDGGPGDDLSQQPNAVSLLPGSVSSQANAEISTAAQTELDDLTGASLDPIQQFSDSVRLVHDPVEQFSATADTVLDQSADVSSFELLGTEPQLQNEAFPFDLFGRDDNRLLDDGFMSVSADSGVGANSEPASSAECSSLDHSAVQSALGQSLAVDKPRFIWEQDGFLGTVFGRGNIVDDLFPQVSLK